MTAISAPTAAWRFDGQIASLACGPLEATLDVATPARGLTQLAYRGTRLDGRLLAVDVDAEPADAYVRGEDLVVAYRESAERPFSVQVYWSAAASMGHVILDATVSIQTRQWEAYPVVSVQSSIVGAAPVGECDGASILRPADADWSYAEAALPEDFAACVSPGGPGSPIAWRFAEQFMERGVIRRLRVRGAFVPRVVDVAAAAELEAALRCEQPPLTA